MKLTLKVWRQKNKDEKGQFETYIAPDVSEHMSFLEMLDVVNEKMIHEGKDPVAFDHDCRSLVVSADQLNFILKGISLKDVKYRSRYQHKGNFVDKKSLPK